MASQTLTNVATVFQTIAGQLTNNRTVQEKTAMRSNMRQTLRFMLMTATTAAVAVLSTCVMRAAGVAHLGVESQRAGNAIGLRFRFCVAENRSSERYHILCGFTTLYGISATNAYLNFKWFPNGLRYSDPACGSWPPIGTEVPNEASFEVTVEDWPHGRTGARTDSPHMFPRQYIWPDGGAMDTHWQTTMIAQTNMNGKVCTVTLERADILSDRSGWRCDGDLPDGEYRVWDVTVEVDGVGHVMHLAVPADQSEFILPMSGTFALATEFYNRPDLFRLYVWDMSVRRENSTTWQTVPTWRMGFHDGSEPSYGFRNATFMERPAIEISNDPMAEYLAPGDDLILAPEHAVTRYVDVSNTHPAFPYTNWTSAAVGIQDAIDACDPGDTVLVAPGVYTAGGYDASGRQVYDAAGNPVDPLISRLVIDKDVRVQAVNRSNSVIVAGNAPGAGVPAARCVFLSSGGAIDGPILTNGHAAASGGFHDSLCGGGAFVASGGRIAHCRIVSSVAAWSGGGLFIEPEGSVDFCTIQGNEARHHGGGLYCVSSNIVRDCFIKGNQAMWGGGGVFAEGDGVEVWNSVFSENTAQTGAGLHGGRGYNCVIHDNTATLYGGGGARYSLLQNCTVAFNSASQAGGGVAEGTNINSILWSNTVHGSADNVSDCLTSWSCTHPMPSSGDGNIDGSPEFFSAELRDLRLRASSPCIDSGTNQLWMSGSRDIEGDDRVFNGRVDIGADEASIGCADIRKIGDSVLTDWSVPLCAAGTLQTTTNLLHPSWTSVSSWSAVTQTLISVSYTITGESQRFFRLYWKR
jgi:hypothetical protein